MPARSPRSPALAVAVAVSVALALAAAFVLAGCRAADDPLAGARDVERRILAPCCRRQTLEDHESEIARALRAEIERRVTTGDAPAAIEDDLVRRYGEDIRAMPRGTDPRTGLGIAVGVALGLGGLVLVGLVRRMRRRRTDAAPAAAPAAAGATEQDYEDRVDDELLAVD